MKPYETYQHLDGDIMTDRDKLEVGSKFWNKGKWDNFVAPLLPEDCSGLSFVDMGCNAGLFLKLAKDRGFDKVIGVDSNREAIIRGKKWRDSHNYDYQLIESKMEEVIDQLPIVDYTLFCNSHYYMTIDNWLDYLDKLRLKSKYIIIVTAEKHHINRCWASTDVNDIRVFFKQWKEVGFVDELPIENDPHGRRLWSLCFENLIIDKVEMNTLDSSNHVQDQFYTELDEGKHYTETRYYRILKKYRNKWTEEKLHRWLEERIEIYKDLKRNGQTKLIIVDDKDRILDGNHRYSMMLTLKYKNVFIRRT